MAESSKIVAGLRLVTVDPSLYGKDVVEVLMHYGIACHDAVVSINGIQIDLDLENPVYDNALITVVPTPQTKG